MAQKWPKITQNSPKMTQNCQNGPKMTQNGPKISTSWKNSTDISAASAAFCISGHNIAKYEDETNFFGGVDDHEFSFWDPPPDLAGQNLD